jgi:hypothetical protein
MTLVLLQSSVAPLFFLIGSKLSSDYAYRERIVRIVSPNLLTYWINDQMQKNGNRFWRHNGCSEPQTTLDDSFQSSR